ncbi:hypothetical protein PR002_g11592 [Phytophthora rubi]|uniref:feruloyl esterase n=1 Tax=Phytophthora rubi TaxID=129364 RepID=A0A6A3LX03_9STRA|nr:hypothetical protein PR002_g11592 [Phytophthora rubi]
MVFSSSTRALLLLSVVVATTVAGGSVLSTLPLAKPAGTCDAIFLSEVSTGIDKTDTNGTSVGLHNSEISHDSAVNAIQGASTADPAAGDARVLQDAAAGGLDVVQPAVDCESLLGVDLSHVAEDGSATVTSAAETTHEGILYCSVEGTLPSSTSWQVMLPVRTWTQRYMQVGCGGLCGMIRMQVNAASGSQQAKGGEFVLAATDMGGAMDGKAFAHNPGRRKSFAYSAQHLTALVKAEVNTIRKFYNGPIDQITGRHLTVGQSQFGSELAWEGVFVPRGQNEPVMSAFIALAALRYLIFEPNPPETYSLNDLQFTEATVEQLRPRHPLLDATNPDLTAFKAAGALEKQMGGAEQVGEFERLYLFPGVQHCGRGEGMAAFDLVTSLLEWVEQGNAPHAVLTSTERDLPPWMPAAPVVTRSRPVFPYPSLAKYTGQGDANDAANFVEGAPLFTDKTADWAGQSFFEPYEPRTE